MLSIPVIARNKDAVVPLEALRAEILAPAGLAEGGSLGAFCVRSIAHELEQVRLELHREAGTALVAFVAPLDAGRGAFVRSARWNVGYRGDALDSASTDALRLIAGRLEAATPREQDVATLTARFFRRPERNRDYLELTPGRKLYLRVTEVCDEDCLFCNATEGNANVIASKTDMRRVLGEVPYGGLDQVIFSGGEPTLVTALPEYVQMAHAHGAKEIIVQTNGWALREPGALDAYEPFKDRLGLGFSLHASTVALSDEMVARPGRHDGKLAAIDRAVEMGFKVKVTAVVLKPNLSHMPEFVRFCWDRWGGGICRLQLSFSIPRGNAWQQRALIPTFTEAAPWFVRCFEFGRTVGLRVESCQSCTIAPCVIPDYIDHLDNYADCRGTVLEPERKKPPGRCEGCVHDVICPGVWDRYLELYGDQELAAVRATSRPAATPDDTRAFYYVACTTDGEAPFVTR